MRGLGRNSVGGEAGNTHYDAVSHCIVVAVQTKNELVAIDPAKHEAYPHAVPNGLRSPARLPRR